MRLLLCSEVYPLRWHGIPSHRHFPLHCPCLHTMAAQQGPGGGPGPIAVCALIATKDRPGMLWQRSVPSVLRQTAPPSVLVLVDDTQVRSIMPSVLCRAVKYGRYSARTLP